MKRLAFPAFVAAYAIFGLGLLFQTPQSDRSISANELGDRPLGQELEIHIDSRNSVITMDEIDFRRTKFVRKHPDGKILIRITGGKPTKLEKPLPDGILLINPSGVLVGTNSIVESGRTALLSTMDVGRDFENEVIAFSPWPIIGDLDLLGNFLPTKDLQSSNVELKGHGNVYALAIKNDGKVRASGGRAKKRVILTTDK